ncbi:hypothetical protein GGI21_000541 [Coemansia aciculifera]|uniref:Uncharacterized protein n=1 Tax=Coemansia aciculifera TaxID=417176 RepID=A0ACC1M7I6_9FUNG|nr:hypothetical protein IWW38_001205 [Coemansia aciculifera]KAJ2910748.1 hypothetical protein GGI21_000541 [Coemansia aciculifera]
MARLTDLPFELLTELLIYSANEELVTVCQWTYFCLKQTSPRICYKFVRQKGNYRKARVIACALQYKFLSIELLDQIDRHEAELIRRPKKDTRSRLAREERLLGDIRLPSRLFMLDTTESMPTSRKRKRRNDNDGQDDAYISRNQQRYNLVKRLLEMKLSVSNERGNTGLLLSAKAGNLPMVRLLLKYGADATSGGENKALLMAIVYGHLDVAKKLVEAGAQVSSLALRYAVQKCHYQIITWLMNIGAAPDMVTIQLLDKLT